MIFNRFFWAAFLIGTLIATNGNADDGVIYTFENAKVNKAIIKTYEDDPSFWEGNPLLIVAVCYMMEKKIF